jgi:hypothetical protein
VTVKVVEFDNPVKKADVGENEDTFGANTEGTFAPAYESSNPDEGQYE